MTILTLNPQDVPDTSTITSPVLGIFQGDLIIRSAILAGLADIRKNPWLLDYIFASLPDDTLTSGTYGWHEVARAKDWFLNTEIKVFLNVRLDDVKLPAISIGLLESSEAESTLGDVHYDPVASVNPIQPTLTAPFALANYDFSTGTVTIPDLIAQKVQVAVGMFLVDRTGFKRQITEVVDDTSFIVDPKPVSDLGQVIIVGASLPLSVQLESLFVKENYSIGCHVAGEPIKLMYLYSIVLFCLLRYKETLFEARGFERSTFSATDFRRNEAFENELVYSRYIQMTGFTKYYWPKDVVRKLTKINETIIVNEEQPSTEPSVDVLWRGLLPGEE